MLIQLQLKMYDQTPRFIIEIVSCLLNLNYIFVQIIFSFNNIKLYNFEHNGKNKYIYFNVLYWTKTYTNNKIIILYLMLNNLM